MIPLEHPDGLHEAVQAERRRRYAATRRTGCSICGRELRPPARTLAAVSEPPDGGRPCDECWRELGAGG